VEGERQQRRSERSVAHRAPSVHVLLLKLRSLARRGAVVVGEEKGVNERARSVCLFLWLIMIMRKSVICRLQFSSEREQKRERERVTWLQRATHQNIPLSHHPP
jgi:hypothetical protein